MLHGKIIDYKFLCFNGIPVLLNVIANRKNGHYDLYNVDLDFSCIETEKEEEFRELFEKPKHWNEMVRIARVLSQDFPFVRVDLYDLEGKVYFGELTFTPADGMATYFSLGLDRKLGELYDLFLWR